MASYAQREDERRFYRKQLDQITGANYTGRYSMGGATDFAKDTTSGGLARTAPERGQTFKYGQSANEKQLSEFMAQQGAPSQSRGANNGLFAGISATNNRKNQVARAAGTKAFKDAETDLQKFFREAEEKITEANDANKSRRDDIMKRLDAKYNRVMGRIENFGHASRADLQERAAEALGNIQANLSARGLGNSTIMASFIQRNQRDLAREQQRLSEMVDTRAMNADMQMTNKQTDFLERIDETGPDYGQLMQLAQQFGRGNGGQGFNDSQQSQAPIPQQQGGLPPGAVAAGRNRGPIYRDMGVGNFLQGIQNSQTPLQYAQNGREYADRQVSVSPERTGSIANTLGAYGKVANQAIETGKDYLGKVGDFWNKKQVAPYVEGGNLLFQPGNENSLKDAWTVAGQQLQEQ